jgi:hypothetical protein
LFDPARDPDERVRDDDWHSLDDGWRALDAYQTVAQRRRWYENLIRQVPREVGPR